MKNAYDGLYSPRDPVTGAVVPTGIRYDPAALALMTDPVTLRLTEPIDDLRDWTEKHIYAPTGWVPALDHDGRISPVSDVPPDISAVLTEINNGITEPSPDWDAGSRVANLISFVYPRYYIPAIGTVTAADGLLEREVTHEFRDAASMDRHGEQKYEYEGIAFAAFGDGVGGQTGAELGATLAGLRNTFIFARYRNGAQAISVVVRRSATAHLRAGDWVEVDLTWFPNYTTGQRHMQTRGQIVGIADLDCAWRRLLIEEVPPTIALTVQDALHGHTVEPHTLTTPVRQDAT